MTPSENVATVTAALNILWFAVVGDWKAESARLNSIFDYGPNLIPPGALTFHVSAAMYLKQVFSAVMSLSLGYLTLYLLLGVLGWKNQRFKRLIACGAWGHLPFLLISLK